MAVYRVLYWQEFPAQVKAEDDQSEASIQLDPRFQKLIDAAAMQRNLMGADEYLDAWHWGESSERPGNAREVAESVQQELESALKLHSCSDEDL
jgi:hypothetical protein